MEEMLEVFVGLIAEIKFERHSCIDLENIF